MLGEPDVDSVFVALFVAFLFQGGLDGQCLGFLLCVADKVVLRGDFLGEFSGVDRWGDVVHR